MPKTVTLEQLLAAAKSVSVSFDNIPEEPVRVSSASAIGDRELNAVVDRYRRHGFAIIEIAERPVTPETLLTLSEQLGLGEPFVPPLYRMGGNNPPVVSRISAASNVGTADESHPSFGRTVEQRLHTDGTLQEIGYIRTTVLLCESPAAEGGETMLFNSTGAFARLLADDPQAAMVLATPGVLVRQANINGCADMNVGPAFTVCDGELAGGYSMTETDRWAVPDGASEADLRRGLDYLQTMASEGSGYYTQLSLAAGQAIVFDNTRISHGRTAYRDSPTRRRCLYRSLHLRHPRARS